VSIAQPGDLTVPSATSRAAGGGRRLTKALDRWVVPIFTALGLAYLMVPIVVMIAFSFNDPPGRFNFVWGEFSLDAWGNPFGRPRLADALMTSLFVAFVSTIIATALGTLIALALTRYQFRGRSGTNLFLFIPLATPEIVLGASLLTMFVGTAQEPWNTLTGGFLFPLGIQTILIAHIMFNISFVVVTVRARMQGFPRHLEEAAMDLGANEWVTFWKVTFPLILPGILAAALLAFSLSIDDFIITQFTSGLEQTFPVWVWASIRNNLPPQVHVIGTMVFVGAVGLVALSTLWERYAERRDQRIAREEIARADAAHLVAPE
jgi:spermidine/putrescine transport system permease protein